ncbi:hypothetical protein CO051_06310 [Candidatus Roizmanbacteria bacterium CG_4_9_14_0_2_um_filter_39_13]|uniref:tRNA dimethylallyltransferase n=2 Tax=Candidatus Roizmaniibacteriota TaxID=1752723 RepID=A0A2M8EWR8_9BACT|nr:MAG: hypothetical protein COY15_03280 [Candidatus Roizmanbacteria bacterium CG_4_10_14_0_2_um_filter_39_12]PJC30324.1 MAG: hypothetical protein CO051_06310 [Candidatus Roizmanbacteria bacterium CG_4_9_14_0_2_um_filter_39_13]PJE61294.1 MAG: hypothetical protein COU87_05415 [Candidatus Roizmanbacteria bacterium CG10_big_fil_rev_8_21_14_0_10_39_12]
MSTIHVITGQTATGKTARAIRLAKELGGELVNADSRQVYKELDIITGKDLHLTNGTFHTEEKKDTFDIGYYTLKNSPIKLWLYDIVDPNSEFSAFDYKQCAEIGIQNIVERGKTPIVIGGSYLYIKNLLYNTVDTNVAPNPKLRERLNKLSVSELQNMLRDKNMNIFEKMNESDNQNPHRLIRKLEIEEGRCANQNDPIPTSVFNSNHVNIEGLKYKNTDDLVRAIEVRIQERIDAGAIHEVEKLLKKGLSPKTPGLNAIGYQQVLSFVEGKKSMEQMIMDWSMKEIQYAKRQSTFMRQNPDIQWTNI